MNVSKVFTCLMSDGREFQDLAAKWCTVGLIHFCRQLEKNAGPTAVQLHTKLYGSKEELEKTATFILKTGLSV